MSLHPVVANLLSWQRQAALKKLDEEIAADFRAGYSVESDRGLERRLEIMRQEERGQT